MTPGLLSLTNEETGCHTRFHVSRSDQERNDGRTIRCVTSRSMREVRTMTSVGDTRAEDRCEADLLKLRSPAGLSRRSRDATRGDPLMILAIRVLRDARQIRGGSRRVRAIAHRVHSRKIDGCPYGHAKPRAEQQPAEHGLILTCQGPLINRGPGRPGPYDRADGPGRPGTYGDVL